MHITTRLIIILLALIFSQSASAQVVSQFTYGNSLLEEGYSIFETRDSAFIMTGYTQISVDSGITINDKIYVLKTDIDGNHIWSHGYTINKNERGYSIIENLNDTTYEYIVVGDVMVVSATKKHTDAFLLRLDLNGNVISITRFGDTRNEHARSVIAVDSGYVFVGYSNHISNTKNDVYLVRTDLMGNHVWSRNIDIDFSRDFGFDVLRKDSSLFITGNTVDTLKGRSQIFLMSTDLMGNVNWVKLYGDSIESEYSYSLKETIDDGFIMIGHSYDLDSTTNSHVYIVKTDGFGIAQWHGKYDFSSPDSIDYGRDILVDQDSSYYGIGSSWVNDTLDLNQTIFKLDFAGGLTWVKSFGGQRDDYGYAGSLLSNNVVGFGTTYSLGSNLPNAYFVNTTKSDSVDCVDFIPNDSVNVFYQLETDPHFLENVRNEWTIDSSFKYKINKFETICLDSANRYGNLIEMLIESIPFNISIYPNPANGSFLIMNPDEIEINDIKIYDITGKEILFNFAYHNGTEIKIEIGEYYYNSGLYNCVIYSHGILINKRIILIKY